MGTYCGGWSGPGAKFRTVVRITYSDYSDGSVRIHRERWLEVSGNFNGGTSISTSWAGNVAPTVGGNYCYQNSDLGVYGYGTRVYETASAGYTGWSGTRYSSASTADERANAPVWQPYGVSNLKVERLSDIKDRLTWSLNAPAARPVSSIIVEVSVDGGSRQGIADYAANGSTQYTYGNAAPDHSYKFFVRTWNSAGYSGWSETPTVYNTPAAPKIESIARKTATTATVTLSNASRTATSLEYQSRKQSDDGWGEWSANTSLDGRVTTFDTDLGGGVFQLRCRNVRGDLLSEWSDAESVVTICPPAAPTLLAPASSSVVTTDAEAVEFRWLHNALDGSALESTEVAYRLDSASEWTVETVAGQTSVLTVANDFQLNARVVWRARTKGAAEEYGPWSASATFYVYQRPTVSIVAPADGYTVADMPIDLELSYIDQSGDLARAALTVSRAGSTVYTRQLGTSLAASIQPDDWMPLDGEGYRLTVEARSTSGLACSASVSISTRFRLPQRAIVSVTPDAARGTATVRVNIARDPELARAVGIDLYRIRGDSRIKLGGDLSDGTTVVDTYAPLNVAYAYEAVTRSSTGSVNTERADGRIETPWWFVIYNGGIARAKWEPSGKRAPDRPEDELKQVDGREWPVLVQGRQRSLKLEFSGWLDDLDDALAFERAALASGDKVYKGLAGDVFHCKMGASIEEEYDSIEDACATVSVTVNRCDGGDL